MQDYESDTSWDKRMLNFQNVLDHLVILVGSLSLFALVYEIWLRK